MHLTVSVPLDCTGRTYMIDMETENIKIPHLKGLLFFRTTVAHTAMARVATRNIPQTMTSALLFGL